MLGRFGRSALLPAWVSDPSRLARGFRRRTDRRTWARFQGWLQDLRRPSSVDLLHRVVDQPASVLAMEDVAMQTAPEYRVPHRVDVRSIALNFDTDDGLTLGIVFGRMLKRTQTPLWTLARGAILCEQVVLPGEHFGSIRGRVCRVSSRTTELPRRKLPGVHRLNEPYDDELGRETIGHRYRYRSRNSELARKLLARRAPPGTREPLRGAPDDQLLSVVDAFSLSIASELSGHAATKHLPIRAHPFRALPLVPARGGPCFEPCNASSTMGPSPRSAQMCAHRPVCARTCALVKAATDRLKRGAHRAAVDTPRA